MTGFIFHQRPLGGGANDPYKLWTFSPFVLPFHVCSISSRDAHYVHNTLSDRENRFQSPDANKCSLVAGVQPKVHHVVIIIYKYGNLTSSRSNFPPTSRIQNLVGNCGSLKGNGHLKPNSVGRKRHFICYA